MVGRLTTNQEVAGSTPASINFFFFSYPVLSLVTIHYSELVDVWRHVSSALGSWALGVVPFLGPAKVQPFHSRKVAHLHFLSSRHSEHCPFSLNLSCPGKRLSKSGKGCRGRPGLSRARFGNRNRDSIKFRGVEISIKMQTNIGSCLYIT